LDNILKACAGRTGEEYARALEESEEVEEAYNLASFYAQSAPPESADDEVNFHFITIVDSPEGGHVFELDGDLQAPLDMGFSVDDLASQDVLGLVKEHIRVANDDKFSLMALVYND
jgi:ubiquitin carboxyl-terminal hydrolase L3